jgi:hypothetical protein
MYDSKLFFEWKITKFIITQQLLKLEKSKHRIAIIRILEKNDDFKTIQFYLIKLGSDF